MRFGKRHGGERMRRIEITPMIDVVFLLIIFFMTAARFAQDTRADVELPKERGEQQDASEEAGVIINVLASGEIVVGGETVSLETLEAIVRDEVQRLRGRDAEQLKLMLRADESCDSGRINQIVAMLRRLGVGAARFATEVPG
jgi:biopolymer transport protein ExbD